MSSDVWREYRETLDSLLEGFQILGFDWTYLYVNPAAARHGRLPPEALHGRRMSDVYPGIDQTPLFATLQRCMHDRTAASFENLFTFPDGSTRWFEIRVEPVPRGLCIHSVDIEDRKAAEARLLEQDSVARLGQMAAVVAHEVKNPLAGLAGALQVLQSRRAPEDAERAVLDQMLQSVRSLDRLVEDLLVFARPMRLRPEPVSVADVIRDALGPLERDERVARHALSISEAAPAPVVRADRDLLKNVFQNLVLNAAQAMAEAGAIHLCVATSGESCRVTVGDTGPGVLPELAGRLFEPFVTGRPGGTGLGLAISRRVVRLHGGDLELLPPSGTGATFLVTLPAATPT
jgi:PAS domain S-box-containing protein